MVVDAAIESFGAAGTAADIAPLPRRWDVLDRLDKSAIGVRGPDASVTVRRSEPAGCILYGPYWQLPAGRYRLSFECRVGTARFHAQPVLGVEIILLNRVQHAWQDFTIGELSGGAGSVVFDVSNEVSREAKNEGRFEFRFFHLGAADVTISASHLVRLEPGEAPPPRRKWRMLGRLEKSLRGTRHADGGVSVRRRAGAGVLLYGGWPYLRLPRGRYRLHIEGRVEAAPSGGLQPVLAVEAIGHSRWRDRGLLRARISAGAPRTGERVRRDIAADELNGGTANLEFAVPTELSLDAGCDAPFEFRLFCLGKADLAIEAVDLERLDDDDAAEHESAASMPAVHPIRRKNIVIVGNCQSEIVRQGFTRVDTLNERFHASYHFVTLPTNLYEFARRDLEAADILLVQDIRDWEDFPLRDCVRPGAETIRFPGVRFASLWPFDAWNGPDDTEAYRREAPNLTFAYRDGLLGRLRQQIADPEQRFLAYRSLDCAGVVNYRRLHDFEERRLLSMDRKFDIAIGAYILEHFRKRRILHTTVRPNRQVLDMLMQYILRAIGVRGRHPLPEHAEALLRNPQIPVHPKVAGELGVRWADENTRYLHGGREVTWESYIRSYIEHYG